MSGKIDKVFTAQEIIALMLKHHGIHSGFYDLGLGCGLGVGSFAGSKGDQVSGIFVGLESFHLKEVDELIGTAVDASVVNPKKTRRKKDE